MAACATCEAEAPAGARFCPSCGASLAVARETRKVVTVLFCDWVDSTPLGEALDPESLRRVQEGYYRETSRVLERHGGTVEKYIGDAVMAVFGIPQAHEDDALRGVRAAVELRDALAGLNERLQRELGVRLSMRTGVNTGPVLAGDASTGQAFVTGDAVNVAKRLEEAAAAGEILIGETTRQLARNAALVEPVEVELKGKRESVQAWRVVAMLAAPPFPRRPDSALVDREHELSLLRRALDRAAQEGSGHLFTIFGPPGVGKSRLSNELIADAADRAEVLIGRCLAYGEGITYFPLVDVVRTAARLHPRQGLPEARERIESLVAGEAEAGTIATRIASAIGLDDTPARPEEISWAFRRFALTLARKRPLVLGFDDLHWAEPSFLDLVENLADAIRDAPVVLLCVARPELLDRRPTWGGGKANATSLTLEPLGRADCGLLIDNLIAQHTLDERLKQRIWDAAEGNPLFVEEIVAALVESGNLRSDDGQWVVDDATLIETPPTIQALLAARLERLEPQERDVLESASVIGRFFSPEALAELEGARPDEALHALVRKELIRPDPAGEGGYRFRHILIRDAAYASMPKGRRAELHARFAEWLEQTHLDRLREVEEIVGYHLAQAHELQSELGRRSEDPAPLAGRAGAHLASAGGRALAREDIRAAVKLLERAATLLEGDPERLSPVLVDLGSALRESGDLVRADTVFEQALVAASDQPHLRARAQIERSSLQAFLDPAVKADDLLRISDDAIAVCEESGDELGLAKAWIHVAEAHWLRCHGAEMEHALDRALLHAERAGARRERSLALGSISRAALLGPRRVEEAIERCNWARARSEGDVAVEARIDSTTAVLEAMRGRPEEASLVYQRMRHALEEVGLNVLLASLQMYAGISELISGNYPAAEREFRTGYVALDRIGERGHLSTMAAFLARALYGLERFDEAEELTRVSERAASRDDIGSQATWRGTRAKLLARSGADGAAELVTEAVVLLQDTDFVNVQADALVDLAETLWLLGRPDDAIHPLEEARRLYEAKGNVVSAQATGRLLARDAVRPGVDREAAQ